MVRSTPSGAGVMINGKWSGRTPLTRETLAFGDYTVRVLLPGYQTRSEQVSLSADSASRTLSMQLQQEAAPSALTKGGPAAARPQASSPGAAVSSARPGPAASAGRPASGESAASPGPAASNASTGTLAIDSRPAGARVFVDDQSVGTTPVRVPDVTPGNHIVRLELADHRTWTEVAQVARGKTARVAGSLEPIR
jgi:hypothetical protein